MAAADSNTRRRAKLPKGVYKRATRDGPVFLALVRLKGFKAVSKTFPAAEEAIAWAAATRKELGTQRERGETRADLPKLTVGGLIREYLADPVTKALRSYETYHDRLDWWVARYGSVRVLDLNVLKLREARATLQRGDGLQHAPAPATINRYLAAMRAVWNWGRSAGLVPTERMWPTKLMLAEPKGRTRYLSDLELKAVLEEARKRGPTEYAMLVVSLAAGIRQGELLRLTWADIDFDRSRAQILLTKNGESRAVHLPATAIAALKAIRRKGVVGAKACFLDGHGEPYTKSTIHYWWNLVRDNAGVKDFHWHDLRHSCASFLAQKGATLLEIGSVLGHKSPSVTMRYAHLVSGAPVTGHAALDEKLRDA
jgi:integrase